MCSLKCRPGAALATTEATERIAPEVVAVQLDQVEGPHKHVRVMVPVSDAIEQRDPVVATCDRLPVDDRGL
jgi:hypothetical protein